MNIYFHIFFLELTSLFYKMNFPFSEKKNALGTLEDAGKLSSSPLNFLWSKISSLVLIVDPFLIQANI